MTDSPWRSGISRRNLLGGASGGFVALTSPSVVSADRRSVEIVTEKGYDSTGREVQATEKVPRPWFEHIQNSEAVVDRLWKRYESDDRVRKIRLTTSEEEVRGWKFTKVVIMVDNPGQFVTTGSLDGVPIEVKEVRTRFKTRADVDNSEDYRTQRSNGCYNNDPMRYFIRPGSYIYSTKGPGTATWTVEVDGEGMMAAANHVIRGSTCDSQGKPVYDNDVDFIGIGEETFGQTDWAVFSPSDDQSLSKRILDTEDSSNPYQALAFTKTGVKNLMSSATAVRHTGVSTGTTNGPILAIDEAYDGEDACVSISGSGVEVAARCATLDSGAPVYAESSTDCGDYSLISMHSGHYEDEEIDETTCNPDHNIALRGHGYPAWRMMEDYGVKFQGTYC